MFIIHTKELAKLKFSNIDSARKIGILYLFSVEELLDQFDKDILEITYLKVYGYTRMMPHHSKKTGMYHSKYA